MSDIQAKVQQVLDEAVASGAERGVQAAVYQNGKLVVDAAAGVTDAESNTPVTPDTLFFATSTGKGLTSTIVHVLAERGVLDYDEPIAKSWPEFAAHGKENATLRQALSHTIGLPEMPGDITPEGLADWDAVCSFIADSEPWWTPGTKTGYHALSFGYIIGEVVRRKTGKPIDEVLDEVVAGPLGISKEVFFGVPESELGRVAKLEDVEGAAEALASMPADMPLFKAVPLGVAPQADIYNRPGYLKANVPGGGTMTARGVARVFAALAGEVDGVRLISDERLHEVAKPAATDEDQIFGFPATKTLGYDFGMPFKNAAETPSEFGAGGLNGSAASIDIATGTAIAVNKNRITMGDYSLFEKVAEVVREHVTTPGEATTAEGSHDTAYSTYLALDTLLAIQRPKTEQHDELLFVIVHQIHELWFKQLLHELGNAQRSLASAADGPALRALRRTRSIIRVLITQIDVLESITPEQFDAFRELLGGSGHQSAQFREIEVVFGRSDRFAAEQFAPGSPDRKRIEGRLGEPALFDSLLRYLAASGYLPAPRGARVAPDSPEIQKALRAAYRDDGVAAQICERFVDLDQLLQEWRFRHSVLARRVIGDQTGTGGSTGAAYLRESVFKPSFPALWHVRDTGWAAD